jgi:hypothetical protein
MKIAITGHTSGIGLALFNYYTAKGDEVIGFSRSNGYDISVEENISKIIKEIKDCDIFFNNAYHELAQVKLLYGLHVFWQQDTKKCMVVTGSRSADFIDYRTSGYSLMKNALDTAIKQCQYSSKYHLLNFKPGFTNTPMVTNLNKDQNSIFGPKGKTIPESMLDPIDLVELIDLVITNKKVKVKVLSIDPS